MTTREKILAAFVGAVSVGGIGDAMLFRDAEAPVEVKTADFEPLITRFEAAVRQGEPEQREKNVVTAAATQWLRNPLRSTPVIAIGDERSVESPLPKYTGYIHVGPQPMAIIEGRDYRRTETVAGGEFEVFAIHADRVELLRRGATEPVLISLTQPMEGNVDE